MTLLAWVEKAGGDPKSLKFVEIPFTATVAAVEAGRVAAADCSYPALAVAMPGGISKQIDVISANAFRVLKSHTGRHSISGKGRKGGSSFDAIMPGG